MIDFFNYIVPIFNKEDILPLTLEGINRCASKNSRIYTVIDGCTDGSEEVVNEFIKMTGRDVIKIYMPNVHMLCSVNAALRHIEKGFSVVMQDDIVIEDEEFETKVSNLYRKMGERLGVVSLRLASNVKPANLMSRLKMRSLMPMITETDFIMNEADNQKFPVANHERFYPKMSAINGPNIIPWAVRSKIGLLDETLAPYGFDDPDYCLRAMKEGFINGLYPLQFKSDVTWGGTRRSKNFLNEVRRIHCRNRKYLWNKHGKYINWLCRVGFTSHTLTAVNSLVEIPNYRDISDIKNNCL